MSLLGDLSLRLGFSDREKIYTLLLSEMIQLWATVEF